MIVKSRRELAGAFYGRLQWVAGSKHVHLQIAANRPTTFLTSRKSTRMEGSEDDDDLKLVKASAALLADLEDALPKIFWKPAASGNGRKVHTQVRRKDLDHVTRLVRPDILDARVSY